MLNLPAFPVSKICRDNTTPELEILEKIRQGIELTQEETRTLNEIVTFYDTAIKALDLVDLAAISDQGAIDIWKYLTNLFRVTVILQNPVRPGLMFRMIWVAPYNLDQGKVRDPKYLSFTPKSIIKSNGWYGRANSPDSTCLYLGESPQVAIYECKPKPGDRIIITGWLRNEENKPLYLYRINNVDNINEWVDMATKGMQGGLEGIHPLYNRMITAIQSFIGRHFTKDIPILSRRKFEYLYSSFFADEIMKSDLTFKDKDDMPVFGQYDGIVYPSIATGYKFQNLAIRESSVSKLYPVFCHEYHIDKIDYNNFNWSKDHLPFSGQLLRKCEKIGNLIVWNDDQ